MLGLLSLSFMTMNAQTGEALDFDGVDDYVSAVETGLPMGSAARTVELWMKTSSTPTSSSSLFSYGQNPGFGAPSFNMMLNASGKIDWYTGSAGSKHNHSSYGCQ